VRKRVQLAACGLMLPLALAACGGGGGGSETEATTRAAAPPTDSPPIGPLRVSGGGSAQFRVEGGDNSVQDFGSEGGGDELTEAATAVHGFFAARVTGEWRRACSFFSADELDALRRFATQEPDLAGRGCPATLDALTTQISPEVARGLTSVDAASLRREGDRGFLIYTSPPGRTVYAMPLANEGGAWKLGAITGAVLPGT
jgi:hypothetical protein